MELIPTPVNIRKPRVNRALNLCFETYLLVNRYWKEEYVGTWTPWLIFSQYMILDLIIAFANINLGDGTGRAAAIESVANRASALTGIRLSITVNTVPVFISAFKEPRIEEIRGRGQDHIKYGTTAVYLAKFFVLNFFRILLFIPFTAIFYPIVGLRGGLDRALMFMLILMIQQYAAISIGLLIASIFADPALASTVVGPILALNILLDGGEINKIIPGVLRWLQYLTISFYAQNALFLNEFEGITLEDGTSSDQVLANFGYGSLTKLESMGYLVIYALLCQFAGIVILKLSCNHYNKKYNKI